jgi:hypothetical protein
MAMSRTHSEGLEPGAWKIIAVVILGQGGSSSGG